MSVTIGAQLGSHELIGLLGKGGMGEVYRARDTKLKREVAIKILPDEFSRDPDRVSRFEREAEVLASLNHPNIAAIYDLQEANGSRFLVLELVEGETLAERIKRGPIPVDESLNIAKTICEALEAAHEKGVVHRDLKPANVKITPDGKVKVLDFGLAKAFETEASKANLSQSPTLSMAATNAGVILGTAAYMSPEQARGKEVDRRTDIFAFGAVLYEMLTGRQAFIGEDVADILSRVLQRDPDWTLLPADVPPRIRELLRLCLEKNAKNRRSDATDVRLDIEQALAEPVATMPAAAFTRGARLAWIVAAAAVLGLVVAMIPASRHWLEPTPDIAVRRFTIETPLMPNLNLVAISPDGRRLAFSALGPNNRNVLWVRSMDSLSAQVLPGTTLAVGLFWSPDSRFIGFFADGKLRKIDLLGGLPQDLCDASIGGSNNGGTWNSDGTIVFSSGNVLYRVAAAGGAPVKITELDPGKQETGHFYPSFLPDGKRFLFTVWGRNPSIKVGSLDGGEPVHIVDAASMAAYSPPGFLLYQRDGILTAQRFDADQMTLQGDPVPIAAALSFSSFNGRSSFSASKNGTLVYTTGTSGILQRLVWYDRTGKSLGGVIENAQAYEHVRLSPDEKRVIYQSSSGLGLDLGLLELSSGIASRFTTDPGNESDPLWSPDGLQVAFTSTREGKQNIYVKTVGASREELLFESNEIKYLEDWSRDGKTLIFRVGNTAGSSEWILPLTGERKPVKLFESPFAKDEVHLSPDGRWVAFNSDDSGRAEVYIASFPAFSDKHQVSNNGGGEAFWRMDGRELFYLSPDGKLMSVEIKADTTIESGIPKLLFQTKIFVRLGFDQYSPSADGQKFLVIEPPEGAAARPTPITVVLDWTASLPKDK